MCNIMFELFGRFLYRILNINKTPNNPRNYLEDDEYYDITCNIM